MYKISIHLSRFGINDESAVCGIKIRPWMRTEPVQVVTDARISTINDKKKCLEKVTCLRCKRTNYFKYREAGEQ